jgi:hypothetical protein
MSKVVVHNVVSVDGFIADGATVRGVRVGQALARS